jgi:hypothetical protein
MFINVLDSYLHRLFCEKFACKDSDFFVTMKKSENNYHQKQLEHFICFLQFFSIEFATNSTWLCTLRSRVARAK